MQSFLKKRLKEVIPHFNNAGIDKHPCRVCGDWWTQKLLASICKDYLSATGREGNGNKDNIYLPKAFD